MKCVAHTIILSIAGALLVPVVASADVVFQTNDPFGSIFGITGFDVSSGQSVAARFEPGANYTFDRVELWLWNNDENGREPLLNLALESDDASNGESRPSGTALESWSFHIPTTGAFNPMLFTFNS